MIDGGVNYNMSKRIILTLGLITGFLGSCGSVKTSRTDEAGLDLTQKDAQEKAEHPGNLGYLHPRSSAERLWDDYLLIKRNLKTDEVVRAATTGLSIEKLEPAVVSLNNMALIEELYRIGSEKRYKEFKGAANCERRQRMLGEINTAARKLLWACYTGLPEKPKDEKQGRDGTSFSQSQPWDKTMERGEMLFLLSDSLGQTNYHITCGNKTMKRRSIELSGIRRDESKYDSQKDEQLWKRYTSLLHGLIRDGNEDPLRSAYGDTVLPALREMADIARNPALSCRHAAEIMARLNFAAGNILNIYHRRYLPSLPEKTVRGKIVDLGILVAETEAPYQCAVQ